MLLVHQLLLDGLGVLGQRLRAGPAQRFMVAWERQALRRDERGGEGKGDRSQTWHWRGEGGEVRGGIVHWADVTACRAVSPHHGKEQQRCLRPCRLSPGSPKNDSAQPWSPASGRMDALCLFGSPPFVPITLASHSPQGSGDTIWQTSVISVPPSASSSMGEASFTAQGR